MKKISTILKGFTITLVLVLTISLVNAQTRTASASGNWNNIATWGGASVPTAVNDVVINPGVTVTVNVAAAACNSIVYTAGATGSAITITGTNSLAVTGAITMNGTTVTAGTQPSLLTVGAGSVSCASLALNPIAANLNSNNRRTEVTLSTGTVTVTGDITCSGNVTGGTGITFSNAGTVNVGGAFMPAPNFGSFTASTGMVNYDGASAQSIENYTYYNLTLGGGGAKTMGGNRTMTGNLLIDAGTTLSLGTNSLTINVNANRTATINGVLEIDGTGDLFESGTNTKTLVVNAGGLVLLSATTSTFPALNARTFNTNSTVEYSATGNQTVSGYAFSNLSLSGSGNKTVTGATVNGTLSMQGTAAATGTSPTYGANAILEYKGSSSQSTSNVEFPAAMSADLVINNPSGVSLNGAKTLSASLTLTNGVLVSSATNLLTMPDGFATVNGGSNTSYVNGPIRKNGNDAFTFPVGKAGLYSPISISAPDNNGDAFTAEYMRASASALGAPGPGLFRVSNCEYWNLNEINDAGAATSIDVTIGWFPGSGCGGSGYITDLTGIVIAHFNGTTWNTWAGTASGNPTTGTVTRTAVNTFSPFTLGSTVDNGNPLPVKFSDVKAFEKRTGIQVEWTNQTETNIVNYIVERSANGRDFTPVNQMAARSNMGNKESYISLDASPVSGANFYRIKALEIDGKTIFSKMLKVVTGDKQTGLVIYPNPVQGNEFTIGYSAGKGQYTLQIVNVTGQQVLKQQINHPGGTISQTVTLPGNVKSGIYNILISGDNYKQTKMFIVQ